MILENVTALYAGMLAILMAVLSIRVPMRRAQIDQPWSSGTDTILDGRIRKFGNFSEYVPIMLFLMWLVEDIGGNSVTIHIAGVSLIAVRIIHAVFLKPGILTTIDKIGRGIGSMGTWLILVFLAISLLKLTFGNSVT